MKAKLVKSTEVSPQGIPLDLGPLIAPYRHHKQLSVRIERMPQLSRLSAGRNNGDCTFSLKIEEILGLVYLPPPGANGSTITLAIRIVNLDDDYATTLDLIDLPVPSEPPAADGAKRKLHVVEAPPDSDDDVDGEPAEPAALQAIHVRRTNPGFEQEAELAELRRQLASSSDDAEAVQKQLLQAAEGALARDFVEQINAAKAQLEREFADRVAEAVRLADTSKDTEATAKGDRGQAEKLKKLEQELAQLHQERDRAATAADAQIEAARKQAADAAEAAHTEAQKNSRPSVHSCASSWRALPSPPTATPRRCASRL